MAKTNPLEMAKKLEHKVKQKTPSSLQNHSNSYTPPKVVR